LLEQMNSEVLEIKEAILKGDKAHIKEEIGAY
jgi:NTP pyrophosphatase (non-canonical NTP hydrolase)